MPGPSWRSKPFEPFGRESARALRALIRRHRPHVVHLHFVNLLSLDVVAAALYRGVRVVFSEHCVRHREGADDAALAHAPGEQARLLVPRGPVIAPSDYVNARLVREGVSAKKVTTVHNGVNLEKFRNASVTEDVRAKYGIGPDSMLVVSISQLIPEKGIGYLIDAAALALEQGRDVSFIHVGDGRCAAEYREKVQRLGIEKRFVFAGLLNLPEIGAILRQSDIFTLPCTWGEAFSLVSRGARGRKTRDRDPRGRQRGGGRGWPERPRRSAS